MCELLQSTGGIADYGLKKYLEFAVCIPPHSHFSGYVITSIFFFFKKVDFEEWAACENLEILEYLMENV